jgi:putative ABC transport system substrate-binding protein
MTSRGRVLVVALLLGVLAAPLAAAAQPGKVYRLGFLAPGRSAPPGLPVGHGLLVETLRELGYVEGRNLELDARYAESRIEELPALAAELARRRPDAIVATSPVALEAVRSATRTIPTVMVFAAADPVELGMVASLARPGGNITGVAMFAGTTLTGKRLELLKEVIPRAARIALLTTEEPGARAQVSEAEQVAALLRAKLVVAEVRGRDYERAFATMTRERADALCVVASAILNPDRMQIIELASRHRLPAIYQWREHVDAGGLMSYGASLREIFRRAATLVDRIFKGANPGDLPVEQPTQFELAINLKTARALGVTIPSALLVRADHVIQ